MTRIRKQTALSRYKKAAAAVVTASCLVLLFSFRADRVQVTERSGPRIVSLAPNLTEIVFALGLGAHLVGVTNFCNFPPDALEVEKVGDFINPSLEKIVSLQPDLVLAEQWGSSKVVARLSQLNLRVVETVSPASVNEIYRLIGQVGKATGAAAQAAQLIQDMRNRVAAAEVRSHRAPRRPTIYVEIDPPSWTVGRRSYTSEAVFLAGGRNLFDDVNRPSLLVSKEKVIEKNPDIILSFSANAQEIRARPGWDTIRAVRENRIIDDFNRDLLSRGTVRLAEGIEQLQARLEAMEGK